MFVCTVQDLYETKETNNYSNRQREQDVEVKQIEQSSCATFRFHAFPSPFWMRGMGERKERGETWDGVKFLYSLPISIAQWEGEVMKQERPCGEGGGVGG